jgi:hypothetical protein
MAVQKTTLETSQRPVNSPGVNSAHSSDQLLEKARTDTVTVLKELESRLSGLGTAESEARVKHTVGYVFMTQLVKTWYFHRFGE